MAYECVLYDCQALDDFSEHYTKRIDSIPPETTAIKVFKLIEEILTDADSISEEWESDNYLISYEVDDTVHFCLDEILPEGYNSEA